MSAVPPRLKTRLTTSLLAVTWLVVLVTLVVKSRQLESLDDGSKTAAIPRVRQDQGGEEGVASLRQIRSLSGDDLIAPPSDGMSTCDLIPEFPLARVLHSPQANSDPYIALCQYGETPRTTSANNFQWNDRNREVGVPARNVAHPNQSSYAAPGMGPSVPYDEGGYQAAPTFDPTYADSYQSTPAFAATPSYGLPWQAFAQGDFVEPPRQAFSPEYRVRVGDNLTFIYQVIRTQISEPYRLSVGDVISIESDSHEELRQKNLTIMPDGTVSVSPLQSIYVAGMTFIELKAFLQERFAEEGLRSPRITVVPVTIDLPNRDLRDAVDGRAGEGGQRVSVTVTWDGYVWLPKINAVPVVGLSLHEISDEVNARYAATVPGIEITPVLNTSAPALAYVLGEVGQQGRVEIRRPTTALQAITQAGGQLPGANMRDVIILRRTPDWRLIATRINLHDSAWGKGVSCDDIWLHDSDIVIVPRSRIERIAELVELYFTRSLYGVLPNQGFVFSYNSNSSIF